MLLYKVPKFISNYSYFTKNLISQMVKNERGDADYLHVTSISSLILLNIYKNINFIFKRHRGQPCKFHSPPSVSNDACSLQLWCPPVAWTQVPHRPLKDHIAPSTAALSGLLIAQTFQKVETMTAAVERTPETMQRSCTYIALCSKLTQVNIQVK